MTQQSPDASLRLPDGALPTVAAALHRAGSDGVTALREAGRAAGAACLDALGGAGRLGAASPDDFWNRVRRWLADAGYGRYQYEVLDEGIAAVVLEDAPELRESPEGAPAGCDFSTGVVGGLLSETADRPVAVLEAQCRSRGHPACRFLVGDPDRLSRIRERLAVGASLSEALEDS